MSEPIVSTPASGGAVSSSGPVAGGPVAGGPVAGGPVAGGPVAGSPVAGSPVAGSPVAGGPVAGGPVLTKTGSAHSSDSGHGHGGDAHGDEIAHVMPVRLLIGVWAALMVLTVITVAVTSVDLGSRFNLIVAMAIATIKAGLVATYFMHLRWDRPFNVLVFVGSLLFVSLFISMTLFDKSEYEADIEEMSIQKGQ